MSSFPPRHICIVGALAIAAGVSSIVGSIAGMFRGVYSFDLGFVGLPIGYGLLIGRSCSRKWANLLAATGALLLAGVGGWDGFKHLTGGKTLPYPDGAFAAALQAGAFVFCGYVLIILCHRGNREWFESLCENREPSKSFAWAVAVTSSVLLISHHATRWWVAETHDQIFPLQITLSPYNAQTGKALGSISYDHDALSFASRSKLKLPEVRVSSFDGREGRQLELSGVATQPIKLTLQSEGYQDTSITLDQKSDGEIKVAMLPLETTKP